MKKLQRIQLTGIIVLIAVLAVLFKYWAYLANPWTRDGQVRAEVIQVTPRVSGPIVNLPIRDNQFVKAGDLLFEIDPRTYQVSLEQARANLEQTGDNVSVMESQVLAASASVESALASISQAESSINELDATIAKDLAEYGRQQEMLPQRATSQKAVDRAKATYDVSLEKRKSALAGLAMAKATHAESLASLAEAEAQLGAIDDANPQFKAALADVHQAELNLEFTQVRAPVDGYVTNLNLRFGSQAVANQPVLALVDVNSYWVVGFFKETLVGDIKAGDRAVVTLMSYPDTPLEGQVDSLGFNLSWEADVWGKFTRQIQSASAALDASVASYDGVMLSLISQVAQNYLLIRTTQQQLLAAQYNLDLQRQSVVITTAKYDAGETSALDVEQALSLMHNTEASLAGLEITLQQLKNSLSVLLGKPPQQMVDLLTDPKPVPTVKPQVALGMPQDLIRRRPDLRTAERQLAAQSAQIGVAAAELYPSFGIGGSVGTSVSTAEGENFDDLFSSGTNAASLFRFFNWNIFNYGRLKSNVRLQDAVFQQLLTDYRESVLEAQAEVENSIVAYLKSQQQLTAFQSAADAAQRAADISTLQYRDGEVDFNTVISTLRSLASQQEQLAAIQGTVATNLVEVYKSLGGGWQIRQGQDSLDLIPVETRDEMLERTKAWQKVFKQNG
jgi:NodT family efflux transporter outer membrane factor (OMF) lipoprotein